MKWYDHLLRTTAAWHGDPDAWLHSLEAGQARCGETDARFWSSHNAVPILHGL